MTCVSLSVFFRSTLNPSPHVARPSIHFILFDSLCRREAELLRKPRIISLMKPSNIKESICKPRTWCVPGSSSTTKIFFSSNFEGLRSWGQVEPSNYLQEQENGKKRLTVVGVLCDIKHQMHSLLFTSILVLPTLKNNQSITLAEQMT